MSSVLPLAEGGRGVTGLPTLEEAVRVLNDQGHRGGRWKAQSPGCGEYRVACYSDAGIFFLSTFEARAIAFAYLAEMK